MPLQTYLSLRLCRGQTIAALVHARAQTWVSVLSATRERRVDSAAKPGVDAVKGAGGQ